MIFVYFIYTCLQPEEEYGPNGPEINRHGRPVFEKMLVNEPLQLGNGKTEMTNFYSAVEFTLPYGFVINRIALVNPGKLVSWEEAQVVKERPKVGLGENGKVVTLDDENTNLDDQTFGKYGYSVVRSDLIALNRTVPDTRDFNCKDYRYHQNLPSVSIILPFHNEAKSILLRSAASIINRSPPSLIEEVLFVDDLSNHPDLFEDLEKGFAKISPKIKILRSKERLGLIQARTFGVNASTAPVLLFLDSHIEVQGCSVCFK